MSLVLEFLPESGAELECVTGDYEAHARGLGVRFRHEIETICAAILQHPLLWRLRSRGYRRVNLPGFPYYVAYIVEEQRIIVVAVAHASRRPGYFRVVFHSRREQRRGYRTLHHIGEFQLNPEDRLR